MTNLFKLNLQLFGGEGAGASGTGEGGGQAPSGDNATAAAEQRLRAFQEFIPGHNHAFPDQNGGEIFPVHELVRTCTGDVHNVLHILRIEHQRKLIISNIFHLLAPFRIKYWLQLVPVSALPSFHAASKAVTRFYRTFYMIYLICQTHLYQRRPK